MSLASPDLLEELLAALQDWEWLLYEVFSSQQHASANTRFEQDVAAARRQSNEAALLKAQRRRALFLRSASAGFVVPAPYNISYWYREPKVIVKRPPGQQARFDHVPTRPKFLTRLCEPRPQAAPRSAEGAELRRPRPKAARAAPKARSSVVTNQLGSYEICDIDETLSHEELVALALAHARTYAFQ